MAEKDKVPEHYPKWKYHATEEPRLVKDADEEAKLGKSWCENPQDCEKAADSKPGPKPTK